MNTEKIAEAVKKHLINLAVNDKLPLDMTDLNEYELEKVIKKCLPTKEEKRIERAGQFLSATGDELKAMVKLIEDCEDENEMIDYIEGVDVWEKVEFSFTVKQFLEEIR